MSLRRLSGEIRRNPTIEFKKIFNRQDAKVAKGSQTGSKYLRTATRAKTDGWDSSQKTDVFGETDELVAGQVAATGPAAGHGRAPGATAVKVSQTGSNRSVLKYWKPRIHFSETGQFRWVVRPHPNLLPLEKGQPLDAGLQFVSLGAEDCRGRQGGGSRCVKPGQT